MAGAEDQGPGGLLGSVRDFARREVREHLAKNAALRKARGGPAKRFARRAFRGRRMVHFLLAYALLAAAVIAVSEWAPTSEPSWPQSLLQGFDLSTLASYLLAVQAGVLGIASVAIAVVTLVAEREGAETDVRVYYHASFAREVVASSLALLMVMGAQLVWPLHAAIDLALPLEAAEHSKNVLLMIHGAWFLGNLGALGHFVAVTFDFVGPRARAKQRKAALAPGLVADLEERIRRWAFRHHVHHILKEPAHEEAKNRGSPSVFAGVDVGHDTEVVLEGTAGKRAVLHDVRLRPVAWALRRWAKRSRGPSVTREADIYRSGPVINFPLFMGEPVPTVWCTRRGGAELTPLEKAAIRLGFVFRSGGGDDDDRIPGPNEVLRDLASKVRVQIAVGASVGFDEAIGDLVDLHSFLLLAQATRTADGVPINLAEVGENWVSPDREYLRVYGEVMESACRRILDDPKYVKTLAYVPVDLLRLRKEVDVSPTVACRLLDLMPILAYRVEAWLTGLRAEGAGALPSALLRKYELGVAEIVGAWSAALREISGAIDVDRRERCDARRWAARGAAWPMLWKHLSDTAHLVAIAVWNDDEIAAGYFMRALLRWPRTVDFDSVRRAEPELMPFLDPKVLELPWAEALRSTAFNADDGALGAEAMFATVLNHAHADVVLLTSALLLHWRSTDRVSSNLAGAIATGLLSHSGEEDDHWHAFSPPTLRDLLARLVRLKAKQIDRDERAYDDALDRLVSSLDGVGGRIQVPWESYSVQTMHEWGELEGMLLSILGSRGEAPSAARTAARLAVELAAQPAYAENDESLREIIARVDGWRERSRSGDRDLIQGLLTLDATGDASQRLAALEEAMAAFSSSLQRRREDCIAAATVDPALLDELRRGACEVAEVPGLVPGFLRGAEIETIAGRGPRLSFSSAPMDKGRLLTPPMAPDPVTRSGVKAFFARQVRQRIQREFKERDRSKQKVRHDPRTAAFWAHVSAEAAAMGGDVRVVGGAAVEPLRLWRYERRRPAGVDYAPPADDDAEDGGIGRVNGIDVFHSEPLPPGTICIIPAKLLRAVRFRPSSADRGVAELDYRPLDDRTGQIVGSLDVELDWSDRPGIEIQVVQTVRATAEDRP